MLFESISKDTNWDSFNIECDKTPVLSSYSFNANNKELIFDLAGTVPIRFNVRIIVGTKTQHITQGNNREIMSQPNEARTREKKTVMCVILRRNPCYDHISEKLRFFFWLLPWVIWRCSLFSWCCCFLGVVVFIYSFFPLTTERYWTTPAKLFLADTDLENEHRFGANENKSAQYHRLMIIINMWKTAIDELKRTKKSEEEKRKERRKKNNLRNRRVEKIIFFFSSVRFVVRQFCVYVYFGKLITQLFNDILMYLLYMHYLCDGRMPFHFIYFFSVRLANASPNCVCVRAPDGMENARFIPDRVKNYLLKICHCIQHLPAFSYFHRNICFKCVYYTSFHLLRHPNLLY